MTTKFIFFMEIINIFSIVNQEIVVHTSAKSNQYIRQIIDKQARQ